MKEAIKKLGPSATRKSLDTICHSVNVRSELMSNFDNAMSVFTRSGGHVQRSAKGDLTKIVNELTTQKALGGASHGTPGPVCILPFGRSFCPPKKLRSTFSCSGQDYRYQTAFSRL